jgi:histidinol-phosphate aminotransferase
MLCRVTTPRVPLRPAVRTLPAYVPGARAGAAAAAFKLSSNENPFAPLDGVREAVERAAGQMNRYPDMFATELGEALAQKHGVEPSAVVAGCGSVAVLGHLLQAFCEVGDEVVHAWRSFEAYPILVSLQGARSVQVPLDDRARHDVPAMVAAVTDRTRAVLLCTPNNPTGPVLRHQEVLDVLAAVPDDVLVVLDEAYVEFVRDPEVVRGQEILTQHPNVVLLRTFSKAYGLAGLRVGYAVAHPDLARGIRTASTPFGVNHLAQVAAIASLEAQEALMQRVGAVVDERSRVVTGLRHQGWDVPDTEANFVWLPTAERTAELATAAAGAGVLVRPFASEGIRVTIGEPQANDRVLELAAGWL